MMDNDQKKIIPGCEKLTKPEEISALSAYLRQGIRENEESLVIGDSNPIMNTPNDPILREIDLSQRTKVLLRGDKVKTDLDETRISLENSQKIERLDEDSIRLKVNKEPNIEDHLSKLPNTFSEGIDIKEKRLGLDNSEVIDINEYIKETNLKKLDEGEGISSLSKSEKASLFSFLSRLDVDNEVNEENILKERLKLDLEDDKDIGKIIEKSTTLDQILKSNHQTPEDKRLDISENDRVPEEKRLDILENYQTPENKRLDISENDRTPEEKRLDILENYQTPEDKRLDISENDRTPEETIISLRADDEVSLNNKKITIKNSPTFRKNERWVGDNRDVEELSSIRKKLSENITSNSSDENITIWGSPNDKNPYERKFWGDNSEKNAEDFIITEEEFSPYKKNKIQVSPNISNPVSDDITSTKNDYSRKFVGDNNYKESSENFKITEEEFNSLTKEELKLSPNIENGNDITLRDSAYKTKNWLGDNRKISGLDEFNKKKPLEENVESGTDITITKSVLSGSQTPYEKVWIGDNRKLTEDDYNFINNTVQSNHMPLFPEGYPEAGGTFENTIETYKYLNLTKDSQKITYDKIKAVADELKGTASENWVRKTMSYLKAALSATESWRHTIDPKWAETINHVLNNSPEKGYQDIRFKDDISGWADNLKEKVNDSVDNFLGNKTTAYYEPKSRPHHSGILDRITNVAGAAQGAIQDIKNSKGLMDIAGSVVSGAKDLLGQEIDLSDSFRSAAETMSRLTPGDSYTKQTVLDFVLYKLIEIRNKVLRPYTIGDSPWSLPGTNTNGSKAMKTAANWLGGGSIGDKIKNTISHEDDGVRNSPMIDPLAYHNYGGYSSGKVDVNDTYSYKDKDGNIKSFNFFNRYLKSDSTSNVEDNKEVKDLKKELKIGSGNKVSEVKPLGLKTTLEEICEVNESRTLNTVDDLKAYLEASPYTTTAKKLANRKMTLDSNHVWEIRLFPFLGRINGYCSWIPSIAEINSMNYIEHGVKTDWCDWIPVTSFELQSAKMTQKTLGLYDGEISYPVSMELSNDLRLTLIDDQFKSWRRYFELCAECSTYLTDMVNCPTNTVELYNDNGEIGGNKRYIDLKGDDLMIYSRTTNVVKGTICPGMYKNLAFRCLIYIQDPQRSTIKKFDLLVVLKDFSIEYSGEADANSPDLNISFSIVGENPDAGIPRRGTSLTNGRRGSETSTTEKIKSLFSKEELKNLGMGLLG